MGSPIVTQAGKQSILDATFHDAGIGVGLFQNAITVDKDTVIGDLTEADFSGYARVNAAMSVAAIDGTDHAETHTTATATFTRGVGATSNTVYGYFYYSQPRTDAVLLVVRNFDAPRSMVVPLLDVIEFDISFKDIQE